VRLTYDALQVHSTYSEATRGVKELRPERGMPKRKPHGSTSLQNAIGHLLGWGIRRDPIPGPGSLTAAGGPISGLAMHTPATLAIEPAHLVASEWFGDTPKLGEARNRMHDE
jgi:hypothetical protein